MGPSDMDAVHWMGEYNAAAIAHHRSFDRSG